MICNTYQLKKWKGSFGKKYTARNALTLMNLEKLYKNQYGVTRMAMNRMFLDKLDRSARILEVGSNIGNQLRLLQNMGFENLYGIEPQEYAVELSKSLTKGINIINSSGLDIPFRDKYFDLVFTSGVLIHISPEDVDKVMKEIYRCSGKYIWGFEYYSSEYEKIKYRGEQQLLWKADFASIYKNKFPDLKVSKIELFKYRGSDNTDAMFLLKKRK